MWLKGIPVGVIASNASGVIYIEAARKATEWMIRCGNARTPVLFLQGSPGYMVGKAEEWGGIGKYGADMVRACSCLEVPKVTYVIGPDHGAANYGMCGRAFKPRFAFTNMRGRTTVMSGETAGFILETVRRKNITDKGGQVDEEEMARFRQGDAGALRRGGTPLLHRVASLPRRRHRLCRGAGQTRPGLRDRAARPRPRVGLGRPEGLAPPAHVSKETFKQHLHSRSRRMEWLRFSCRRGRKRGS